MARFELVRFRSLTVGFIALFCVSVVTFSGVSAKADSRERRVTERLLEEGNSLPQSTVDSLLEMIERGHSWDEMDSHMAYHNLFYFVPFTEETSLKVLNLVTRAVNTNNSKVDIEILLNPFIKTPVVFPSVIAKLQEILVELGPSRPKISIAQAFINYSPTRETGVALLGELLKQVNEPNMQIFIAYSLLKEDAFNKEAEAVVIDHLKDSENAATAIQYGVTRKVAKNLSENLLNHMTKALDLFSPVREPGRELLNSKREQMAKAIFFLKEEKFGVQAECLSALDPLDAKPNNVIPLRPRVPHDKR